MTGVPIQRREFVTLLGGAAAAWPLAARAQQAGKLPTIGFLGANASAFSPWTAAFVSRLRELGWIDGRTIAIEYRWSEGRTERYAEIAAEFVRLKVDVIVTVGSAVPTVRQATAAIPIVFAVAIDPVGSGLVASLNLPGGNVTGVATLQVAVAAKRLEVLHELVPTAKSIGFLVNPTNPGFSEPEMKEVQQGCAGGGSEVAVEIADVHCNDLVVPGEQ
jgi:putative ABC transport system substrate-binding protein